MEDLETLGRQLASWISLNKEYSWMAEIFLVLMVTGFLSLMVGFALRVIGKSFDKTRTEWDNIALEAAYKPSKVLVWVIGVSYAVGVIAEESQAEIFKDISNIRDVAVVFMLAWALNRFITAGEEYYIRARQEQGKVVDITTADAVTKLLRIAVHISMALIAMQNLGISISGLLAFGGIGGIAVGFAAQGLLANFFGAMIIYFDKPFKVGDWIRSPDKSIEGTVEEIGWRMTTIRTFDKRPLYVPNAVFTEIVVENPSRMRNRRIYEIVGIRYDDIGQMNAITDAVRDMLKNHEAIDTTQTLIVNFDKFNASSCDFFVYTFTKTTDWVKFHEIKHEILLKIADIIEEHKAEIAFPTQTLHMGGPVNIDSPQSPAEAESDNAARKGTKAKNGSKGEGETA